MLRTDAWLRKRTAVSVLTDSVRGRWRADDRVQGRESRPKGEPGGAGLFLSGFGCGISPFRDVSCGFCPLSTMTHDHGLFHFPDGWGHHGKRRNNDRSVHTSGTLRGHLFGAKHHLQPLLLDSNSLPLHKCLLFQSPPHLNFKKR